MRPLASLLVVAALAATLQPSHAQPARRAIIPRAQPTTQPTAPGGQANTAPGLCQCLYPPSLPNTDFGKTHLRFACSGGIDQCKSSCNTTVMYSFIPTAPYSCEAPSGEPSNQVATQ